jgi:hypothetical protein
MTDLMTHQDRPAELKRLLWEISELRAQLERIRNFRLTAEENEALPETVRYYNHYLQNVADPVQDDVALVYTRQTIQALASLNEELRKLLGECFALEV